MDERLAAYSAVQVGVLERFAPYGARLGEPDVRGVLSDVPSPMFNVVADARFAQPRRRTAEVVGRLRGRGLPFLWLVTGPAGEVGGTLMTLGLQRMTSVVMHRPLAGVREGRVLEEVPAIALVPLAVQVFALPDVAAAAMRERAAALDADAVHVVVREHGRIVAGGSGLGHGSTWGLFNIATLASHRGRGLGDEVVRALLAAGQARGYDAAVLDASPLVAGVYERAGFEPVDEVNQYVWLP